MLGGLCQLTGGGAPGGLCSPPGRALRAGPEPEMGLPAERPAAFARGVLGSSSAPGHCNGEASSLWGAFHAQERGLSSFVPEGSFVIGELLRTRD